MNPPDKTARLSPRSRAILLQAKTDMITYEVVRRRFFPDGSIETTRSAARSAVRRLCGTPPEYRYLCPEPLDDRRVYFRLTPRGAKALGISPAYCRGLKRHGKGKRYAVSWFIHADQPGRRMLVSSADLATEFALDGHHLPKHPFFIDEERERERVKEQERERVREQERVQVKEQERVQMTEQVAERVGDPGQVKDQQEDSGGESAQPRLGFILVDHNAHPRRIVRKTIRPLSRFLYHGWFDEYIRERAFMVALLTFSKYRKRLFQQELPQAIAEQLRYPLSRFQTHSDGRLPIDIHVQVIPGLMPLVTGRS